MKELDGKSCLYEKSKYVCGILKVKACNKCKFRAVNTQENYQKKIVEVEEAIEKYKINHLI